MQRPSFAAAIRRIVLALAVVVAAAGCAAPDESVGPADQNRDVDRDGVPDDEPMAPEVTNESVDDEGIPILTPHPDLNMTTSP